MNRLCGTFLIIIAFFATFTSCNNKNKQPIDYTNGNLVSACNQKLTETISSDLFSPPVSSRIYTYPNIAAYEVLIHASPDYKSFAGQLNGLETLPRPEQDAEYNYAISAFTAFLTVAKRLVYTETLLSDYQNNFLDSVTKTGMDPAIIERSVSYGKQIADAVFKWSAKDNFKKTRGASRYVLLKTPEAWEPTPPDYLPAVEPHWGEIRPFVIPQAAAFRPDSLPVPFSPAKNSTFYKNALDVYHAVQNLDSNQRSMSVFWDCNPNVSTLFGHLELFAQKMTPAGHWMAITALLVKEKKLNMTAASAAFAITSIALADAMIACWDAKYYFQTIRPVTYINKYIDPLWNPILQTPPFPEFPSGHSTISAAAATVLTDMFGNNFSFTDSSEVPYRLPVRSFVSLNQAADEVAESRFYGGIHFMPANESGKIIGRKVGALVIEKLKTKK
jgi:hypothetical protein